MPQQRGEVSSDIAEKLIRVNEQLELLAHEKERLIVAAMKAGASYREVAAVAKVSNRTIREICDAHGWPDKKELARRAAEDAHHDHWRKLAHQPPAQRRRRSGS